MMRHFAALLALPLIYMAPAQAGLSKVPQPGNQVIVDEMLSCLDQLNYDWKREDTAFYRATSLDGGRTQLKESYVFMAGPEDGALTVFAKGSSQKFNLSNGVVNEEALLEACNSNDPVNRVKEALREDAGRYSFEIPVSSTVVRQFKMNPFVTSEGDDGKLTPKAMRLLESYEAQGCSLKKFASSFSISKTRPVVKGPFLKKLKVLEPQSAPVGQRDDFSDALSLLAQEKLAKARSLSTDPVTGLPSGQGYAGSAAREVENCRNQLSRDKWKSFSLYESLSVIREDLAKIESTPGTARPNKILVGPAKSTSGE